MTNNSKYRASVDITDKNYETFLLNLPGIIFVGILAIVGTFGNALVLYVYIWKIKPSNHRIFIIFLAVVDLTVSVIAMPFTIYEQIYPLMQYGKWMCKMRYIILYLMITASILILLVIAGDRYQKVCKPLKRQMSVTHAKVVCVVVVIISALMILPQVEVFGLYTVETDIPGLTGTSCYIDEAYVNTSFFIAQSVFSISIICATFVVLSILYFFVILKIRQQTKRMKISGDKNAQAMVSGGSSITSNDDHRKQESAVDSTGTPMSTRNYEEEIEKRRKMEFYVRKTHGNVGTSRSSSSRRITLMLFMITIVFLISYFPFIIIEVLATIYSDFGDNFDSFEYCAYNFFQWSFFVNNIANPIIYGFYDKRFIKEMKICFACPLIQHK